ncbi:MAG: AAA family ATPase [Solirubrobacteraceae bacterium]
MAEAAGEIVFEEEAKELARKHRQAQPKLPLMRRAADMSLAQPVQWAWQDRIALEVLTLLVGQEGAGKGTLTPWIIARITRGKLPGDLHGIPANVAVVADEDDFDRVWTPRLYAAKADLRRVELIEPPDDGYISLSDERLHAAVEDSEARLLYLDSLVDNLGGKVNDWHAAQLRHALRPAKRLAKDLNIGLLATLHTNKSGESARQVTPGSHQYGAVARGSIFLMPDPDEPGRTLLAWEKSNLAKRPRALTFEIREHTFRKNGRTFTVPLAVDMQDGGELSATEAIGATAAQKKAEQHPTKAAELERLLRELLPDDGEWHLATPLVKQCEAAGHGNRNVSRARNKLGIAHRRQPETVPAPVEWRWPTAATTAATRTGVGTGGTGGSTKTPANTTAATAATTDTPTRGVSAGGGAPDGGEEAA